MAQAARSQDGGSPFVLLVSDRSAERQALARAVGLVTNCRAIGAGDSLPAERPDLLVLDLNAVNLAKAAPALDERPWRRVPQLVLTRGGSVDRPLPPRSRTLPATAPREAVLAGIFGMISAAMRPAGSLGERGAAATTVVADLFDSAALGARIDPAEIDHGTAIVLDAVSEAGIRAWLEVVWHHDSGVYQHTLSVAGYAAAFGTRLGLNDRDHRRLVRSGLLHDIGKSRIPAEILNKPARLSPEEARLMQRHPGIGADLLTAQGGTEPAVIDAVRHHHERIDGRGYPDRLSGAAISDLTRLVAICDVFSALTERRAYRAPIAPGEALAMMAADPGHLDAALLTAFGSAVPAEV